MPQTAKQKNTMKTQKNHTGTTEKKKLQDDLQESQSKFEAIFNSISDAVVFVDQQRKIITINKAFTEILGYEVEEVAGKTV